MTVTVVVRLALTARSESGPTRAASSVRWAEPGGGPAEPSCSRAALAAVTAAAADSDGEPARDGVKML